MKNILSAIVLFPLMLCAQNQDQNYVKTKSYNTPTLISIATPSASEARTDVSYFDGLGRPVQKIAHQQSSTGKDIITFMTYDVIGRQDKEYLPYTTSQQNMNFDADSENNALNYPQYSNDLNPYNQKFYDFSPLNRILKQAAPGTDWMGNENSDSDHAVKFVYDTNSEHDKVWQFSMNTALASGGYFRVGALSKTITKDENWTSGKTNTIEEFQDHLGRTVLKRAYQSESITSDTYYVYDIYGNLACVIPPLASTDIATVNESQIPYTYTQSTSINQLMLNYVSGGGAMTIRIENNTFKLIFSAGFNSTEIDVSKSFTINASQPVPDMTIGTMSTGSYGRYTVYIQNNQLKFIDNYPNSGNYTVLNQTLTVPLDTALFGTNTVYTTVVNHENISGLCYQYKYDHKSRLIEKKLPGKQWEFIVYDRLDRVVATGPANNPFGEQIAGWNITKYDAFGRPAYTGWYIGHQCNGPERANLQALMNSATVLSESRTASNTIDNVAVGYTNSVFPTASYYLLGASYYDDYTFPDALALPSSVEQQPLMTLPKGMPTGAWNAVLGADGRLGGEVSQTFYDAKGRPVSTYVKNYLGGLTHTFSRLDFSGKTLYTVTSHKRSEDNNKYGIREEFAYSDQGRLVQHTHQVNLEAAQVLAANEYDELGQLTRKHVGGLSGGTPLQHVDYAYSIRGWLKEINNMKTLDDDLFAFRINYNTTENTVNYSGTPLFNGNISETHWHTASDNIVRMYGYSYDALNRLREATYRKPGVPGALKSYDEQASYDKNGNIVFMERNGHLDSDNGTVIGIDKLEYRYEGNQLKAVEDGTNSTDGFLDNAAPLAADDYKYDENGNMVSDANKNIEEITYNHLNLPVRITMYVSTKKHTIDYLYTASGEKRAKTITDNEGVKTTTDYLQGFQHRQGVLQFFPHAEGYVSVTDEKNFNYVYNYTDHLGNVRLSYGADPANGQAVILEENHYYPFGLKHRNYNAQSFEYVQNDNGVGVALEEVQRSEYQYKYNGKEFQDELGLNLYDYGARNYDPAIGRWMNIDPLAEKFMEMSPFVYGMNNPIYFIDPDGMASDGWIKRDENGQISMTYDPNVNTVSEAVAANYTKVVSVSETAQISSASGSYSYDLNADGSVTNSSDGSNITFHKPIVKEGEGIVGGAFQTAKGTKIFTSNTGGAANPFTQQRGNIESMDFSSPFFPAAGIFKSMMGSGSSAALSATSTQLAHYYPPNGGAMGAWSETTLSVGTKIDRYGPLTGKYFSPINTRIEMRALAPGSTDIYNSFQVMKPFSMQSSTIAPAFGKIGTGTQYYSPLLNAGELIQGGYLMPLK